MGKQHSVTETMTIADVENQLSHLLERVDHRKTRILVEKDGVPIAAIVPAADLTALNQGDQRDQERAERFKVLDEFAAGFADQSVDEIEREAERALEDVRAERARCSLVGAVVGRQRQGQVDLS